MLAIAGGKGGVGKMTTTLALSAALPDHPFVVGADREMPNLADMAGAATAQPLDAVVEDETAAMLTTEHRYRVVGAPTNDAP